MNQNNPQVIGQMAVDQRMLYYFRQIFSPENTEEHKLNIMDEVNFHTKVFPEIIKMSELLSIGEVRPGYATIDGKAELCQFIKGLELARLCKNNPEKTRFYQQLVDQSDVGYGNGCTGVLNLVFHSIIQYFDTNFPNKYSSPEIVLTWPNYALYTAQLAQLGPRVIPKHVHAARKDDFLPTFTDIREQVTENTVAISLTYPSNPSQATYEGQRIEDLKKLIDFCQENEIFLIADNIYQDLLYPAGRRIEEVFSFSDSIDYIIKVYGASKDAPFYAGYRTGYWFGDPRIGEAYRYKFFSSLNSLPLYSNLFFALHLYFKTLMLKGASPTIEDMRLFKDGIFGFAPPIKMEPELWLENILATNLHRKYEKRITRATKIQEMTLGEVKAFVRQSDCFSDYVNQDIGNVFFTQVNPRYFAGNDHDLFNLVFHNAKCSILPGAVFGLPVQEENAWFRITLINHPCNKIIENLQRIETCLKNQIS